VEVAAPAVGFGARLRAVPVVVSTGDLAAHLALLVSGLAVLSALLAELQVSAPVAGLDLRRARVDLPTETAGAFEIPRARVLREVVDPGFPAATPVLEDRALLRAVLQVLLHRPEGILTHHVVLMALIPKLHPARLVDPETSVN